MFAIHGDVCWVCSHPGATQADHVIPMRPGGDPAAYLDLDNLRPAHGVDRPCPYCGRKCNQERGGQRQQAARAARPPAPTPAADKQARADLATLVHHPACPCRAAGYARDKPVSHSPDCLCGLIAARLAVPVSRCW
jgi:hypothetical protein